MSDADVVQSLEALELLLKASPFSAEAIADWREGYDLALESADRGPEWPAIQARAHQLAAILDQAAQAISLQQNEVRKELSLQAQGARALKGYRPA